MRNGCEPSNSELTLATRLRLDKVVETTRLMLGALGIISSTRIQTAARL